MNGAGKPLGLPPAGEWESLRVLSCLMARRTRLEDGLMKGL